VEFQISKFVTTDSVQFDVPNANAVLSFLVMHHISIGTIAGVRIHRPRRNESFSDSDLDKHPTLKD